MQAKPPSTPCSNGTRCRRLSQAVFDVVLGLARDVAVDGRIALDDLERVLDRVTRQAGALDGFFQQWQSDCERLHHALSFGNRRNNLIGRVIVQRFAHLLDDKSIPREILPQFMLALRMMLGEELHESLQQHVQTIAGRHHGEQGLIDWNAIHADPETALVVEKALVAIAQSFHRFDMRRHWFMVLLNSAPRDDAHPLFRERASREARFSDAQFLQLMGALFAGQQPDRFDAERRAAFLTRHGKTPEQAFAPCLAELARRAVP